MEYDRALTDAEAMILLEEFIELAAPSQAVRETAAREAQQTASGQSLDYAGLAESLLGCAVWAATWSISEWSACNARGLRSAFDTFARQHRLTEAFKWKPEDSETRMAEEGFWRLSQWLSFRGLALYGVDTGSDGEVAHFVVSDAAASRTDAILLQFEYHIDCPMPHRYDPRVPPRLLRPLLRNAGRP